MRSSTEGLQLLGGLDPLGQQQHPDLLGERHQRLHQGPLPGVVVDAQDERAVELDDVGLQQQDVPQAREAGAGVVDGGAGAERAQGLELGTGGGVVAHRLLLGDLDDQALEVAPPQLGQHGGVGERDGGEVDGEERVVRQRRLVRQRTPDGHQLELGAAAVAARCQEPAVGGHRPAEPGERLDAEHLAGRRVDHRLQRDADAPGGQHLLELRSARQPSSSSGLTDRPGSSGEEARACSTRVCSTCQRRSCRR
jgi:hypothetical protein